MTTTEKTMSANPFPLEKAELLEAYRIMKTIREFEERLHIEFAKGDIPGFVHLYAGEEAYGGRHHDAPERSRPHRLDASRPRPLHRQGRRRSCDDGRNLRQADRLRATARGGSMHIADLSKGMMGANGILGAGAPLICGAGLAAKFRGDGGVGITFFGDGASNQGMVLESMNLAAVWNLPVIFVCREQRLRRGHLARLRDGRELLCRSRRGIRHARASSSTARISSPSMKPRARSSSARARAAARRCSNARWSASSAISKATRRPTRPRARTNTIAPTAIASRFSARRVTRRGRRQRRRTRCDRRGGPRPHRGRRRCSAKSAPLPAPKDLMTNVYVSY